MLDGRLPGGCMVHWRKGLGRNSVKFSELVTEVGFIPEIQFCATRKDAGLRDGGADLLWFRPVVSVFRGAPSLCIRNTPASAGSLLWRTCRALLVACLSDCFNSETGCPTDTEFMPCEAVTVMLQLWR